MKQTLNKSEHWTNQPDARKSGKVIETKKHEAAMGVIHHRQNDGSMWRWDGVDVQAYTSNDATKQVIIGKADGANNFEVRYFTIPPHGFSSLDEHQHDHGVVIVQGRARVMLGEHFEEVGPGDVVYIPGFERHQFENLTDDLFTFLCIIPPKPPVLDAIATKTDSTVRIDFVSG